MPRLINSLDGSKLNTKALFFLQKSESLCGICNLFDEKQFEGKDLGETS